MKKIICVLIMLCVHHARAMTPHTVIGTVADTSFPFSLPTALALTPDGQQLYVANIGNNSVSVVNVSSNSVTATVSDAHYPFNGPQAIAITADGQYAYVVNNGGNSVSILDLNVNTVIGTVADTNYPFDAPVALAITADGQYAYVVNNGGNSVSIVDLNVNTVIGRVSDANYPFDAPVALAITGNSAYVANLDNSSVSVVDVLTNTVTQTVSDPQVSFEFPDDLAITPNGQYVYVTNLYGGPNDDGSVSVIDSAHNVVLDVPALTTGLANPTAIAITPNGRYAYVANLTGGTHGNGSVNVIDLPSNTITSTVADPQGTLDGPYALAITPDGEYVYVANYDGNSVSVIYTGAVQPPTGVRACRGRNIFVNQVDTYNLVSWTAPVIGNLPVSYTMYRDAALTQVVATVPAQGILQYYDHNRDPYTHDTYYIVSVDQYGNISSAASTTANS